jgi:hypothetical protein
MELYYADIQLKLEGSPRARRFYALDDAGNFGLFERRLATSHWLDLTLYANKQNRLFRLAAAGAKKEKTRADRATATEEGKNLGPLSIAADPTLSGKLRLAA